MRFIFLLKWFFWDEITSLYLFPIGENFSELVGPKIVNIGIPEADIRWPHPVSFEIPNLQVFEILIVFKGSVLLIIFDNFRDFFIRGIISNSFGPIRNTGVNFFFIKKFPTYKK